MKVRRSRSLRLILCALIAAVVLVVIVIALLARPFGSGDDHRPTARPSVPSVTSPTPSSARGAVVDPRVAQRGWVPEPITRDQDTYARAALEAAGSFDTRKAARAEWLTWLDTWFTPSPLYTNRQDALDQMAGYQAELDESVVLPQQMWDSLASEGGRVTAQIKGDIAYLDLPETSAQHMWTASADMVMHYTRTADGQEVSYDETVRASVQVVCGGKSVPTANSAQRAGDCKVVRYFDSAVG